MRVQLNTERLRLDPLNAADRDALLHLHADPRVSSQVGHLDPTSAAARLERTSTHWRLHGYGMFAIREYGGDVIGRCGFVFWPDMGDAGETEIGWVLRPDHWGRGLATEAARACLDWARMPGPGSPGLGRVTSMIRPGNERSEAVARKLGMAVVRHDRLGEHHVRVFATDVGPPAPP